jgi:Flp pilus assembly protein TadD
MNGLMKKMLVFLLVMAVVAAGGWFGRKAYKRSTERRLVTEASQYLEKKDFRNAVLCLQRAIQVNPVSAPASVMMADMLESAGAPAALSWRIRAAQLEPSNMTNRMLWAQTAIKFGDLKSAGNALAGVDEKSKGTAMYHKLSGAVAWNLGRQDEADKEYREALRLEPDNPAIVLNLDTIGLASSNSAVASSARDSLEKLAANPKFRLIALRYLAVDATTHKSYVDAIKYCAQIVRDPASTVTDKIDYLQLLRLAKGPSYETWLASLKQEATHSPTTAFALGKWMATSGDPADALRWLETLPETVQTNQPVPLIISDCLIGTKDWRGLLTLVEKQDWAEGNCFRLALVSLAQRSLQDESASQTAWRKALHLAEHRLDNLSRLAQVTAAWGWNSENTGVLKEIITEFPKEKWAENQLTAKLYEAGNTRELGELLSKLYAADSTNAGLKNNLASICLLQRTDLDTAYRLAQEAYDSSPENPFFISTYAYSLLLQNKQDEALKVFSGIKPEYLKIPSVAAYYGVVEAQSGHKDLAKASLERAASAKLLPEEMAIVRLAQARM